MMENVQQVFDYHQASKHHFDRYAQGPRLLDWASQPDPFRRYLGAPLFPLDRSPPGEAPAYDLAFIPEGIPPAKFDLNGLSRILLDSLALSAWKRAGSETWALRVNPSSGNLHPTEGYIISGPIEGLDESPVVCHYAPREHALELRTRFLSDLWHKLIEGLPEQTILLGLTSIHWREAWKYGVRAYRYCRLDIGHALAAVCLAAAGLGRQARLLDGLSTGQLACLFGLFGRQEAEPEEPDCLMAIYPRTAELDRPHTLNPEAIAAFTSLSWHGRPNRLSTTSVRWSAIDTVALACQKPPTEQVIYQNDTSTSLATPPSSIREISLRQIIHGRRSAVVMDGVTSMLRSAFYGMLLKTLPGHRGAPFVALPWEALIHLALFVHRVDELPRGLYFLVRDIQERTEIESAMGKSFIWEKPVDCPDSLELYLLAQGDVGKISTQISCFQDIAGDGCFSVAMIGCFDRPQKQYGSWFYPRLFWECGMIGQVLYLEAEAEGLRGTGIGCYFDEPTHEMLGLKDLRYQDLYHFTVGGPVEDPRLTTLPPYPG
jgi:SagB-type dehydrogenase family enzyme